MINGHGTLLSRRFLIMKRPCRHISYCLRSVDNFVNSKPRKKKHNKRLLYLKCNPFLLVMGPHEYKWHQP